MPALVDPGVAKAGRPPERQAGRWADLGKRTLSAAVLAPSALLCIWLGSAPWFVLMAAAAVGLGVEWAALCRADGWRAMLVPATALLTGAVGVLFGAGWALGVLAAACGLVWWLSGRAVLAAGVAYVGVPTVALIWLRGPFWGAAGAAGRAELLFLVAVVWACDIGAYVVGRLAGGPKLAPAISPGKTWSGAIGGLVIAIVVGTMVARASAPGSLLLAAILALVLAVVSILGDLLESWIKRQFGVKDSGRLIPGHGGLLDRLDGLLAAAPVAALLAAAFGQGGVSWS